MRAITKVILIVVFFVASFVLKEITLFFDGTSNKQHSWSPEAIAFAKSITNPVEVTFYVTQDEPSMPYDLRQYRKYVERMLKSIALENPDKIEIKFLDPKPGSQAEESAKFEQISPLHYSQNTSCYFGLSFQCAEKRKSIPFLSPDRRGLLKYDILHALDEVSLEKKAKLSVVSSLPIMGGPGGRGQKLPQWLIIDELKRFCEVRNDSNNLTNIEQSPPDLLLVIHPQDKDGELSRIIESYVSKGGNVVLMMDPFCVATTFLWPDKSKPELHSSKLTGFLDKLGVKFEPNQVVVDMDFKSQINRGFGQEVLHSVLDLSSDALSQESVLTSELTNAGFAFAGYFELSEGLAPNTCIPLIKSSLNSALVESKKFENLSRESNIGLINSFSPDQQQKIMALVLQGTVMNPSSRVVLFSDVDFVFDPFAAEVKQMSAQETSINPINSNFALVTNAIDSLLERDVLIAARSHGGESYRLKNLEKAKAAIQNQFQSQKAELELSSAGMLEKRNSISKAITNENAQDYFSLKKQVTELDDKIELNKVKVGLLDDQIKKEESNLLRKIQWTNILGIPIVIILAGLFYISKRQNRSQKSQS